MSFSPRQWIILLVLIAGFATAALLVRDDGGSGSNPPPIDEVAWCAAATDLAGTGDLFTGERPVASVADVAAAQAAVFSVETIAPWGLRPGLARLADLSQLVIQEFDELGWPEAHASAWAMVDGGVVEDALGMLETEMAACGRALYSR